MRHHVRIRQSDDLDQVSALDRSMFDQGMGCLLDDCTWWVAECHQGGSWEPVGYAGAHATNEGRYAFLARSGVVPAARGIGLQKRLIRVRTNWAKAHGMDGAWSYVYAGNIASMRSLLKCGYVPYVLEDSKWLYMKRSWTKGP